MPTKKVRDSRGSGDAGTSPRAGRAPVPASRAVYAMAVAAELTGVNPPMLRAYEERG